MLLNYQGVPYTLPEYQSPNFYILFYFHIHFIYQFSHQVNDHSVDSEVVQSPKDTGYQQISTPMITEDSLSSTVVSSVPFLVEASVSAVQPSICTIHPPLVTAQASISTVQLSATPSNIVQATSTTAQTSTCLPRDCKVLLHKDLSQTQKLQIILNFTNFNPTPTHQFPTKTEYGKQCSFQKHYLESHKWLGYSVELDGCLCLPCCLFASNTDAAQNFIQNPYSNWTALNNKVSQHSKSSTHVKSVAALKCFVDAHSGTQPTITIAFEKHRKEQFDRNCKKLDAIIDCVILCGKQNIPFRGHRDSNDASTESLNKGNFKAILDFRAKGDPVLQAHLATGPRNAQYTSPGTQNEIISICRVLILRKIAADVKDNQLFSIICDECTDSANQEQLPLSICYVAKGQTQESFLGYFELAEGTTGEAIASTIQTALAECHLDPGKMRGQRMMVQATCLASIKDVQQSFRKSFH